MDQSGPFEQCSGVVLSDTDNDHNNLYFKPSRGMLQKKSGTSRIGKTHTHSHSEAPKDHASEPLHEKLNKGTLTLTLQPIIRHRGIRATARLCWIVNRQYLSPYIPKNQV
jgi:hypothetical protein